LADFGLFGQLKALSSDHTPMLIMRERTPSVYDWVLTSKLSTLDRIGP
jgi:hypothetical protein